MPARAAVPSWPRQPRFRQRKLVECCRRGPPSRPSSRTPCLRPSRSSSRRSTAAGTTGAADPPAPLRLRFLPRHAIWPQTAAGSKRGRQRRRQAALPPPAGRRRGSGSGRRDHPEHCITRPPHRGGRRRSRRCACLVLLPRCGLCNPLTRQRHPPDQLLGLGPIRGPVCQPWPRRARRRS